MLTDREGRAIAKEAGLRYDGAVFDSATGEEIPRVTFSANRMEHSHWIFHTFDLADSVETCLAWKWARLQLLAMEDKQGGS